MQTDHDGREVTQAGDDIRAIVIDPAGDGTCSLRIFHADWIEVVPCTDETEALQVITVRLATLTPS